MKRHLLLAFRLKPLAFQMGEAEDAGAVPAGLHRTRAAPPPSASGERRDDRCCSCDDRNVVNTGYRSNII